MKKSNSNNFQKCFLSRSTAIQQSHKAEET